jgi:hypothetical protein
MGCFAGGGRGDLAGEKDGFEDSGHEAFHVSSRFRKTAVNCGFLKFLRGAGIVRDGSLTAGVQNRIGFASALYNAGTF